MAVVATQLDELVEQVADDIVRWRRHLHQHPELSFEEENTAQFVYDTLSSFGGLELSRPTKTSVMARLFGKQPGKVLAVRADMDALPITEENGFDFVSTSPGVMHACGHDGHTAMLLGTAKILSGMKDQIRGEVRFLFQHAEELFPGGAQQMVDAGVLDGVDFAVGIHLISVIETGTITLAAGPLMAAPDTFEITIIGKGGHAAHPNQTVDSIAIAAQVVTNLQHIVSRNTDPIEPLVVSVTTIHGGTADNVIPGSVQLGGTVRTFDAKLRETVPGLMERIVKGVTEAHDGTYAFRYLNGYRPVINDAAVTDMVHEALLAAFDEGVVQPAEKVMGGEDFSAYQQRVPGTFFFVGAGNRAQGIVYPHHHPRFTIDEAALPIGVKAFLGTVFKFLG